MGWILKSESKSDLTYPTHFSLIPQFSMEQPIHGLLYHWYCCLFHWYWFPQCCKLARRLQSVFIWLFEDFLNVPHLKKSLQIAFTESSCFDNKRIKDVRLTWRTYRIYSWYWCLCFIEIHITACTGLANFQFPRNSRLSNAFQLTCTIIEIVNIYGKNFAIWDKFY